MKLYKVVPRTPFHFGERGIGQEETADFPHSDTLIAALISAWRFMYPENEFKRLVTGLTKFDTRPPLLLSSAFPYIGDVYFLPRPVISLEGAGGDRKRGKQVAYISWRQAEDLIRSDEPSQVETEDTLVGGRLWVHASEKAELMKVLKTGDLSRGRPWSSAEAETMARVAVDRLSSASALYYQGMVYFAKGCGFYVLADLADEGYREPMEAGLHFLAEQGLGGRRSVGLGQFQLEDAGERELGVSAGERNYYWLLSLYHPTADEVRQSGVLDEARYTLITRRGWIYSPDDASQRRRGLRMLAEGSLLTQPAVGNMVDVQPTGAFPHEVWRAGLALTITTRRWHDA
jgi:CRISPR-associated protein Csm4